MPADNDSTAEPKLGQGPEWIVCDVLFLTTLVVRLVPAWMLVPEASDILTYRWMAETTLRHDNVYALELFFPYTPYSQFIPAAMLRLAETTGWPFSFTMKLPCIFFDGLTAVVIFSYLFRRAGFGRAAWWTLFWALNPVSILVSAFHGNLMTLVPALIAMALAAAPDDSDNGLGWLLSSALLLGLAIAVRSFPILLLPVFLLFVGRTLSAKLLYACTAGLATVLSTAPYLVYSPNEMLREVFGYAGSADFGWVGILRTIPLLESGIRMRTFDPDLLQQTKGLFLLGYALVVGTMPFWRKSALPTALLVAPLVFYATYGGVAAQYFVWVVPLAIMARDRTVLAFSIACALALVGYYGVYHSPVLFGEYPSPLPENFNFAALYFGGNVAVLVLVWAWVATVVGSELSGGRNRPPLLPFLASGWLRNGYISIVAVFCLVFGVVASDSIDRGLDVLRVKRSAR